MKSGWCELREVSCASPWNPTTRESACKQIRAALHGNIGARSRVLIGFDFSEHSGLPSVALVSKFLAGLPERRVLVSFCPRIVADRKNRQPRRTYFNSSSRHARKRRSGSCRGRASAFWWDRLQSASFGNPRPGAARWSYKPHLRGRPAPPTGVTSATSSKPAVSCLACAMEFFTAAALATHGDSLDVPRSLSSTRRFRRPNLWQRCNRSIQACRLSHRQESSSTHLACLL